MTAAFDKLKATLEAQGSLSEAEIAAAETELGAMTEEERVWISIEVHDRANRAGEAITVEQYMAANKILDTAAPGSPEYVEAERIVNAFESAA